jgi:molybdopterin biosynthesis enzyme
MRGQWVEGENAVAPLANQDTSALSALARADVLIRRETGASALAAGERVDVVIL